MLADHFSEPGLRQGRTTGARRAHDCESRARPAGLKDAPQLVTGAARGIGEAIARELAGAARAVAIADRDGDLAKSVAAAIVADGGDCFAVETDIAKADSVAALAAAIEARWGRLDILVNNAAILDATPLSRLTRARFRGGAGRQPERRALGDIGGAAAASALAHARGSSTLPRSSACAAPPTASPTRPPRAASST